MSAVDKLFWFVVGPETSLIASRRRTIGLVGHVRRLQLIEMLCPVRIGGVTWHTRQMENRLSISDSPLNIFTFLVLDVADDAKLFDGFPHNFGDVLKPIVNCCKLFLDDAFKLPKGFEQLCCLIAFDVVTGHKGR